MPAPAKSIPKPKIPAFIHMDEPNWQRAVVKLNGKRYTKAAIARLTGMSHGTVLNIAKGISVPTWRQGEIIKVLCKQAGVEL